MRKLFTIKITVFVLFQWMGLHSHAADTTYFKVNAVQDSVYAGDTIDLDIFIGDNTHQLLSIKQIDIEVSYNPDLCDKTKTAFTSDPVSLSTFFSGLLYTVTSVVDVLGHLKIHLNSLTGGSGYAKAGRTKYIVQDNVAGRQMLHYDFFQVTVKDLLGNPLPVKMYSDSVLVNPAFQVPTSVEVSTDENIKIYPNPALDVVRVQGMAIQQYRLIDIKGDYILSSVFDVPPTTLEIKSAEWNPGSYLLQIQSGGEWHSYKLLKQ